MKKNGAAVLYMPSIGMDLTTIFASNTRLAPVQVIALGHPATTHSDFIEYVIVEDDYVGSEKCFSEQIIAFTKRCFTLRTFSTCTATRRISLT